MPRRKTVMILSWIAAFAVLTPAGGGWAQTPAVPADAVTSMTAAMPGQTRDKPLKPRKLLVFTLCRGYPHASIPYAAKALEIMGAKTGAFETVTSDDVAMFEPDKLRQFDAVCLDNTTGELFTHPDFDKLPAERQKADREREARLKASLLEFVAGGKGIVGIHAATDSFYKWPQYGEMIGAWFDGHPWTADVTGTIKVDDPRHPLCRPFKGRPFKVTDELYQFRDPYSRDKLRVLLSLDTTQTDMKRQGIKRQDNDFAVSWVRAFVKGRVFYCSLGHNNPIFWDPAILRHYLAGIQFALGDLKADTTPSAKLGPPISPRSEP